jgi:hypothetical protein
MTCMPLIDAEAGNWVDRGQPPEPELVRLLVRHLGGGRPLPPSRLTDHALALRGMVEADVGEAEVADYLALVEREAGAEAALPREATAAALWHIVKCAEVRDRAVRRARQASQDWRFP